MSNSPRCLEPMKQRADDPDPNPVCWRPKGHKSRRHQSRKSWRTKKKLTAEQYERWTEHRKSWQ